MLLVTSVGADEAIISMTFVSVERREKGLVDTAGSWLPAASSHSTFKLDDALLPLDQRTNIHRSVSIPPPLQPSTSPPCALTRLAAERQQQEADMAVTHQETLLRGHSLNPEPKPASSPAL